MKHFCIVLSLLFFLSVGADAQTLTNKERRYINSRVLGVIEQYERSVSIEDKRTEYQFRRAFGSASSSVYCDLIGTPMYQTDILLDEYVAAVKNYVATAEFVIKNVRKGEFVWKDGRWLIPVTLTKSIFYFDCNGYVFSTKHFYGKDFDLVMDIVYDPSTDKCFIDSISGRMDSETAFPSGRFMIVEKSKEKLVPEKHRKYFNELQIGGQSISYNEFGQAILPAAEPSVKDMDVTVLVDTLVAGDNYDAVGFRFDRRNTRLKPHFAYAPFGAYDVTTSTGVSHRSSAMEFGVDYGVTWPVGRSSKMGFFAGMGLSISRLNLSAGPFQYGYGTSMYDSGTGLYKKLDVSYSIDSASEGLSFTDLYVPLYLEFEHKAGGHVLVSWGVGAKFYANLRTKYDSYSVAGSYSIKDETITPDPEPVMWNQTFDRFLIPVSYKRNPYDISAFARLGLDVNLYKKRIYFSLGASFEFGITDSYVKSPLSNPYVNIPGSKDEYPIYPIIYNPYNESHIALHSLVSNTSYRRQALWLEAGIKIKL